MKTKLLIQFAALTVVAAASLRAQTPAADSAPGIAPLAADPVALPPAEEIPAPAAGLPAPDPNVPPALPGLPPAGAPPPPIPAELPRSVPTPPRAADVPPPPPGASGGFRYPTPPPGPPGALPGAPPKPTPAPGGGFGYGGSGGPAEVKPSKKYEYHDQSQFGPDKKPLTVVTKEKSVQRGEDIIRDTKLKVYQRHYETVLNEAIQARLTLLDAPPEKQEALKARQAALEEIAKKLETDIRELSGPPRISSVKIAPGGGPVIVSEPKEGNVVIKEVHVGPGAVEGAVELRDGEGNTLRLAPTPARR